jgi:hypothetical protein
MTMSRLETRTKESSVFVNGYNSSWKRGMKVKGMNNTNLASMGGVRAPLPYGLVLKQMC